MTDSIINGLIVVEITLFIYGFFYGAINGNKDINIILRSLWGGCFCMFWFITIPLTIWDDK